MATSTSPLDEEAPPAKKYKNTVSDEEEELVSSLPFKVSKLFSFIPDITGGQEKHPIPCANWIDEEHLPSSFQYIPRCTVADKDVTIPTEQGFMIRCYCSSDDSCLNSRSCPCRHLTEDEGRGVVRDNVGVVGYADGSRLLTQLISGVYECNQYCQCKGNCGNRVVQYGVKHRLMVYRTEKKGWGVMNLEDIPQGSFVCCYVGQICTNDTADKRGVHSGDDYLAELDYIEVVEHLKEGYESFLEASFFNKDDKAADISNASSSSSHNSSLSSPLISVTNSWSHSPNEGEGEEEEGPFYLVSRSSDNVISLSSGEESNNNSTPSLLDSSLLTLPSCRSYYHEKHCYVVDANKCGNIARFLNHSCSPNLFVQNVFVDTHDLRFPCVAFFAKTSIAAFSELCWDYNYIIGSVEGRQMLCYCGSSNCRQRLL